MPWRISSGSKPVTTIGTLYLSAMRIILSISHDRADVAGGQEALHALVDEPRIASIAGGTSTCETSSEKFSIPCVRPARRPWHCAGAVVSKPRRRRRPARSDLPSRSSVHRAANRRCGHRRPRLDRRTELSEPGTRSMSPKEQKITSGRRAIGDGLVDQFKRRDADRAAGAVHQLDLLRQQLIQSALDDGVGLARRRFP